MLVVPEDRGSILSCHNERNDYPAKIVESKNVKIAGILIAITGLLVAFSGLLLFILCGSVSPAVTVPLFAVSMIMLICGAVLSLVFYRREKAGILLEGQIEIESVLDRLAQRLVDLRSKSERLFRDSLRCKEELECSANTFAKGITDSHRKLSEKFHQAIETGIFWQKKTDLKSELESLQEKLELYSETVRLNIQLHDHIKSGEDFCLKFDCSEDIINLLVRLGELQEEALALSKTILKEEDPKPFEVMVYKKDLEKLLMRERSIYNGMTDKMRVIEGSLLEDWNMFKVRCNVVIKKARLFIDGLSQGRLIVLRDRIYNELEAGFNTSAEFMMNFIQTKLENLFRLKRDISSAAEALLEGFPLKESLSVIDEFYSATLSLVTVMEKAEEANSSQELERRRDKKISALTINALAVFKECDQGVISLAVFLQQALNNKRDLLDSQSSNYELLLKSLTPFMIDFCNLIEQVDPDERRVLIEKLHTQSEGIAEAHGVSLTKEMTSCRNEEVLFKKVLLLVEKFSDDHESYWCHKGLHDNLMKLFDRLVSECLEEQEVVLDEFVKEITEQGENLPTDEKYLATLIQEESMIAEWKEISQTIADQIDVFSEVYLLRREQRELQGLLKEDHLPREDNQKIRRRCADIHICLESKKADTPSLLQQQLFAEFQNSKDLRCWFEVMEKVEDYYNEAQACFKMLRLRAMAESILNLFHVISTEESPLCRDVCLEIVEELSDVIIEGKELEQSLMTLNAKGLLKELGDLSCVIDKLRSTLHKFPETIQPVDDESSDFSDTSQSLEDCVSII